MSVVCNAHLSNESYLDWKTVNVIIILIVWKEMSTLTNMNKCDTFHASMYLFRSLWHYFVAKKKECSPSRHQYCRWNPWAQRSGLDDCKRIPYGDRISSLFDILHSTNSQSFENRIRLMEKGFKITYLIGNSLPLHLKRVQFTLLIALKWFLILLASFPMKIRRMHAVYKIYVTVVLTFLQRSSRIHMFFFYDSPKGKKKN